MDYFSGKTILLTGASGYLASGVQELLAGCDCRIVRLVRQPDRPEASAGRATSVEVVGDVRDPEIWARCLPGCEVIFHFAAQTSSYAANADPLADQEVNVRPLLRLLEACRALGTRPTLCFASTVTVAGIPRALPVDESHPDHPLTVYDLHKRMAEDYLRWYSEQGWVNGVALRLPNVYGPGPRSSRADRGVLNQMIRRALDGEPLTVYGDGAQLRDYLFIDDAARAFVTAARHGAALRGRHFVLGTGMGHSIAEALELVAARVAARTGRRVALRHVAPPEHLSPIEGRDFIADAGSFAAATGWRPSWTLTEGIDRTLEVMS